ncbi:AcrR family transcriptional regulator [Paraburkholderia sp. GAS199]|uniref:TetR/AcrR family transcriptional regulator n=1 Tax=Paraburkholderia sp. GAS199 TaxID=3035126 RepID=UPI003D1F85B0
MAGKPAYDESAVLTQAVKVFWTHGYAGTAISDLVDATGLSRSSLYQRFVDKDGLFLEALAVYHERVIARMKAVAEKNPSSSIEAILRDFAPSSAGPARPSGCFVARSCVESPSLPDALKKAALKCLKEQHAVFVEQLERGIKHKEVKAGTDTEDVGWYYLGVFHAVLNFSLLVAKRKSIDGLIDTALLATKQR